MLLVTPSSLSASFGQDYIYIYIYISRDLMWENMRVLPSVAFYAKRIKIFSSATLEIRTN